MFDMYPRHVFIYLQNITINIMYNGPYRASAFSISRDDFTRILLYHGTTWPRVTHTVGDFLYFGGIKTVPHPPYSPDLATSDYYPKSTFRSGVGNSTAVKSC